jgi:hypothetical protein
MYQLRLALKPTHFKGLVAIEEMRKLGFWLTLLQLVACLS